ncbi:MAG: FAD-binding protein, partial [Proteobacteria bacterium]|nr:FAD-binding protein [Pseudomonadota bacterium]
AALIRLCAADGLTVRAAGAGHSHSPVVMNEEVIIDTSGLSGVIEVDPGEKQAWIRAGSPIYSLGRQLHEHGLALRNQGDIDRQLLGGVIATGTHGTGRDLQNLSAAVVALRMILPTGEKVTCSRLENPDIFEVARLGIGSAGLVTDIRMQLTDSVVLQESGMILDYELLAEDIGLLTDRHERFEFFWYPGSDSATVKIIDPTDEGPIYPLAEEGERQAWSFEVLPSHRPHLHTEMEYSIPRDRGRACFEEIRSLIRRDFPAVSWPVEYRTVAADDIWLSMASGRDTVTISVHQDIREDETDYYRACESVFLSYGGRPHWGKVNYLSAAQLAGLYPQYENWWRIRKELDPDGIFLNAWARSVDPTRTA